uniref:Uncharacterized protein n=1 Tax=Knipowitschia caucasica TaxID=637954 RepID=A0AAV2JN13_KNICA
MDEAQPEKIGMSNRSSPRPSERRQGAVVRRCFRVHTRKRQNLSKENHRNKLMAGVGQTSSHAHGGEDGDWMELDSVAVEILKAANVDADVLQTLTREDLKDLFPGPEHFRRRKAIWDLAHPVEQATEESGTDCLQYPTKEGLQAMARRIMDYYPMVADWADTSCPWSDIFKKLNKRLQNIKSPRKWQGATPSRGNGKRRRLSFENTTGKELTDEGEEPVVDLSPCPLLLPLLPLPSPTPAPSSSHSCPSFSHSCPLLLPLLPLLLPLLPPPPPTPAPSSSHSCPSFSHSCPLLLPLLPPPSPTPAPVFSPSCPLLQTASI